MTFEVFAPASKQEQETILDELIRFNSGIVGPSGKTEISVHVKDEDGEFVGGANGFTHWNYFFVAHVWLSEKVRGRGVGKQLLDKVEEQARQRGCDHIWLDTFSFQAAGFYEKCGYQRFGELPNYPAGRSRVFFFKRLNQD